LRQQIVLPLISFTLPALEVTRLHDFFCLRPQKPYEELHRLAAATVTAFDVFRQPADAKELEKRRAADLSPRQEYLLQKWGIPM
jgi:hypothetical protein